MNGTNDELIDNVGEKLLSHTSRETKQKWMLPEVLDLMEEKNKQIMHIRIKKNNNKETKKKNKKNRHVYHETFC